MLRSEQLQSLRDESHNRLLSRKRKLCQLYWSSFATDDSTIRENAHYLDNERAFLDANDLARNRLFDESTLPKRPQITRQQPRDQSTQTSHSSHRPSKRQQSALETWISTSSQDASPPSKPDPRSRIQSPARPDERPVPQTSTPEQDSAFDGETPSAPSGDQTAPLRLFKPPTPAIELDAGNSRDTEGYSQHSPAASPKISNGLEILPEDTSVQLPQTASSTEDKIGGQRVTAKTGRLEVEGTLNNGLPSQHKEKSEARKRDKSPLVLAPITVAADPQSSPASTNGAASTNTPDPTPASPTTSPGDEDTVTNQRSFQVVNKARDIADEATVNGPTKSQTTIPKISPQDDTDSFLVDQAEGSQDVDIILGEKPLPTSDEGRTATTSGPSNLVGESGSRKPPMRIDTRTVNISDHRFKGSASIVESPAPLTSSATPRRMAGSHSAGQSPHRRETRIASGAIERRSVSDILGETPKSYFPHVTKSTVDSPISASTRDSFDLSTSQGHLADREKREKERSKLSTVVFAKPQAGSVHPADSSELLRQVSGEVVTRRSEPRDYLHTLFESKAYSPPRSAPLASLLQSAHKTLSTADHLIDYQEQMNCRTLKRIYQLQNANRWPLRQMQRAVEPARATSHWDFLLDHAKWMRTDFREERKWRLAAARGVAEWCAEWVASSGEERLQLQVPVRPPRFLPIAAESEDMEVEDQPGPAVSSHPTPDLVASAEDDSISDGYVEDPVDIQLAHAPAAIFSLGPSDFSYPITKTPAADKLLNELPLYEPTGVIPDMSKSDLAERSDAKWRTDIVAISRFATCKLKLHDPKPPTKRSRYDYVEDSSPRKDVSPLPPEQTDVALFMAENKHIRDRIHPGHSFRPPSEHPMPSQAFFESRSSSQWTHAEDDELRKLVKDYSYNWSLISSCLSPKSLFVSGADRRTPWECFERWIGLEGLPTDMLKTPYFRAYHSRIEAAGRHVIAQQEAAQRQAGNNAQVTPKKRTTQPVRVERKRNQKHLAMLDAMRKLAKKRETALQKQQHAADLAAMRKVNEANQPRPPISTPAEFSRLKHEREIKMQERQELYRQQVIAHQKAAMQQRTAQQMAQGNPGPNGLPRSSGGLPPGTSSGTGPAGIPNGNPGANGLTNQQRGHPNMTGLPPGGMPSAPMPANMMAFKGMSPAQVQAGMAAVGRGMAGHSPEHVMRVNMEAARLHQQQMLAVQAQQSQQRNSQNGPQSSPSMTNANMANVNQNAALLAQYSAANGAPSPSVGPNGNVGSPRLANGSTMGQALSSGHTPAISQIVAEVQARHPEMSAEEVQRQATQRLSHYQKQQAQQAAAGHTIAVQQAQRNAMNQAALNAAAGAVNAGVHNANNAYQRQGMMTNEQAQAFHLARNAQQLQQRGGGLPGPMGVASLANGAGSNGMTPGMTASPVMSMARPASQHSRSATPREQRSGSINGAQGSPRVSQQGMQT